ncbi:MAG: LacI family DNA-binding transcriptional regulator [Puniceicoccaceae bacterium]|nr:LacI family DNA-binding transcriptional regulator [Puniceicoccaceae bacterium]
MSTSRSVRPNMQQIADAAGVSKSSVSLALRNDPRLAEDTTAHIQKVANDMGYCRNPIVDNLMSQLRLSSRSSFLANIALLNCAPFEDLNSNHTFQRLRKGVYDHSQELGYGVEEFWLQRPDVRPQRIKQILDARGIKGLILVGILKAEDVYDVNFNDLLNTFATSVIGTSLLDKSISCATNDQYLTARRATLKVLEMGYKRPLLLMPKQVDTLLEEKFSSGYYSIVRGIPTKDQLEAIDLDLSKIDSIVRRIREIKADVIITNSDDMYGLLENTPFDIPQELGLVHLDWHPGTEKWAGMRQNHRVVGRAGVDIVVGQLNRNEFGAQEHPLVVEVESTWVDGPSVSKVR